MNYKKLGKILGKIMILEAILMLAPLAVAILYQEGVKNILAFAVPIFVLLLIGILLQIPKSDREELYQKEGFALTALVWVVMTLFGAIPFVINGDIPNYIDAWFEIMSGFTTTGSSVITDLTAVSHATLFWRSFSHWIGGMGILVFVLIFIPESDDGSSMHLLRAESPGPQVGKIVSKMKVTTRILYLIYLGMTALQIVILYSGPLTDYNAMCEAFGETAATAYHNDKLFYALLSSFGCAGTGGFGFLPGSIEYFTPFAQYVMSIFLILFGVNFSLYYLFLVGKVGQILKSEEFKSYFLIIVAAVAFVFLSLVGKFEAFPQTYTTEEAFRHSLFQVASLMTTAGYTTTDYDVWPMLAKMTLVVVMFIGAMAGSTAGGIKVSRIVMALKGAYINVRKLINPRYVPKAKFEGKPLEETTINDVFAFITLYFFLFVAAIFLLSFDSVNGTVVQIASDAGTYEVKHGFFSNFSAALTCISNVGPAFEAVGPYASFAGYNAFSKIILTLTMMLGRLEILPVFILFSPKTWKKV
ncbi:MAG: TrkH family potassium uptake protein [Clostridia bacterium]|nr:TrkH family potassium uptake protein [Clostridia bacterium]